MTKNQLEYYKLVETNRANRTNEALNRDVLSENKRHNTVTEGISAGSLNEQIRHNLAGEDNAMRQTDESIRHNLNTETATRTSNSLASDRLKFDNQKEQQRIEESLRDFYETVRYHNMSALTSKGLAQLIAMSGMGSLFSKAGIALATTGAGMVNNIQDLGRRVAGYLSDTGVKIKTGVESVAPEAFIKSLSYIVQHMPLMFDQQKDLITPIRPSDDSNIHNGTWN